MSSSKKTISIDSKFFDIISKKVKDSEEFSSVEEYIDFILKEVLNEEQSQNYDEADKKEVEEKLRTLGYI